MIPFYGYILGIFSLILLSCLVIISLGAINLGLKWNNTTALNNPIHNILETSKMNLYLVRALNYAYDYKEYS